MEIGKVKIFIYFNEITRTVKKNLMEIYLTCRNIEEKQHMKYLDDVFLFQVEGRQDVCA